MPIIIPINISSPDDGLGDTLRAGGEIINDNFSSLNVTAINNSDTGVFTWAGFSQISPPAPSSMFTVEAGTGQIVDNETDPAIPTVKPISWIAQTLTALDIGTKSVAYVLIDSNSIAIQQSAFPTPAQRRENIFLGLWGTVNKSEISDLTPQLDIAFSKNQGVLDVLHEIGIIRDGAIISANANNLSIDISAGILVSLGVNFPTNNKDPNRATISPASPKSFFKVTQRGFEDTTSVTALDPENFDNGIGVVDVGSPNDATNQRVFLFPSGLLAIAYGQEIHSSIDVAVQNADKETFILPPGFNGQAILIASIALTKNAMSLENSSQARILIASTGGVIGFGASGIPVGTLQNIFDNSVQPQITTSATSGALQVQRGSASNTDVVTEVLNGVGTSVFSVTGAGLMTTTGMIVVREVAAVTGTFGVNSTIIGVTNTSVPITITISSIALVAGRVLDINDETGVITTNNPIIVNAENGLVTIDGLTSQNITADFGSLNLYSDGANWFTRNS